MDELLSLSHAETREDNPSAAGKELIGKLSSMQNPASLVIVFCSHEKYGKSVSTIESFVKAVTSTLSKTNPGCRVIGCTSHMEITVEGATQESAIALGIATEYLSFGIGSEAGERPKEWHGKNAALSALKDLKVDKEIDSYVKFLAYKNKSPSDMMRYNPYMGLLLSTGFASGEIVIRDGERILDAVNAAIGREIPFFGSYAGIPEEKGYVFTHEGLIESGTAALLFSCNFNETLSLCSPFVPDPKRSIKEKDLQAYSDLYHEDHEKYFQKCIGFPGRYPQPFIPRKSAVQMRYESPVIGMRLDRNVLSKSVKCLSLKSALSLSFCSSHMHTLIEKSFPKKLSEGVFGFFGPGIFGSDGINNHFLPAGISSLCMEDKLIKD